MLAPKDSYKEFQLYVQGFKEEEGIRNGAKGP
jgi:hypothetical protein